MNAALPIADQDTLAVLLERFPELRADVGTCGQGWVAYDDLGEIPDADIEKHLALQALGSPGLDRRGQGAFLIGDCAYALASVSAVLHLHHSPFPLLTKDLIAVSFAGGEEPRLNLRLAHAPDRATGNTQAAVFAGHFVERLSRIVERLFTATRLGRGAQWRLAADMLAAAFLHYGKLAGQAEQAETDALAILAPHISPLSNPQVGFQNVSVTTPAGRMLSGRFITRGGCCRYYTATGGSYCSTCVMRKPGDQQRQLQDYLIGIS